MNRASPSYPPPPEVLAHPMGHACYSCKPHYKPRTRSNMNKPREVRRWSARLGVKEHGSPVSWGSGDTALAAFKDALKTFKENRSSYRDLTLGVMDAKEYSAFLKASRARKVIAVLES